MSIASEIARLQGVKADILAAIAAKGVTVPSGSVLDDCPALIASIPTGGSYADVSGFETALYVEFDSVSQLNSLFNWSNSSELNALDFGKEVRFSFYIPQNYFASTSNWTYNIVTSYYGSDLGDFRMYFYNYSSLTFSFYLPSSKDMGGISYASLRNVGIDRADVEGRVSTVKVIGDKLIFNGYEYTIPSYSSVNLDARPQYFYMPSQTSFMQGYRFYGLDCGSDLRIRAAKRLSDNAVCLVNLITGNSSTANQGGFILGPSSPMP